MQFVVEDSFGTRLDQYLAARIPELSRARIQALIKSGDILLDGRVTKAKTPVERGMRLTVEIPDPEPAEGTLSVNFGADRSSPQSDETDLTLEAEAEGGEGDLSYQFLVDGKEIQDSDKTTAAWDTVGGDHTISVVVTDEEGHQVTVEKDYSISGEIPDPDPEPAGEIKVSSFEAALDSPQTQGTSVKFTVKAEGGEGELQYRFYREKDDNVTVFRDYSISRSAYCDPAPGSYTIYVDVKDETGKVVTDSIEYKWIKADNPLTIHSFTASVESPQKQGTSVKLTVDADGGEGTLQYRFYRQGNGITTVFRDYAASSTAYCNPPVEGTYILYVDVKDESGVVETYRLLYQWE